MGKTVISSQFQYLQVPVYNADTVVHKLLDENKKVIDLIKRYFPQTLKNGNIDRSLLGDIVFKNDKSLEILEQIIYPYLHINKTKFLTICARRKCKMVIFFRDPLEKHPHEPDVLMLLRICDVHNVPLASNPASAKLLIKGISQAD